MSPPALAATLAATHPADRCRPVPRPATAPLASRVDAAAAGFDARGEPPAALFRSAEEAWFWFVRCQVVRRDGARFTAAGGPFRPCDPDDVYLVTIALRRQGVLDGRHLDTLGRFGLIGRPPDRRCREQEAAARLWEEALDRLTTPLRRKGIVG